LKNSKSKTEKHLMKTIIKTYLVVVGASLVCLASLPALQAVLPPPDGGYAGFNTAEGQNALFSLTIGTQRLARFRSLATPRAISTLLSA
jgi:hypothetical protein